MKIVIAADPSAIGLKDVIKQHLEKLGHSIKDVGTTTNQEVDFFNAATRACRVIQEGNAERGILFCGSGMGVAIVAGKQKGIFAACVESVFAARMCRSINNANVLCLGAMIWGEWMAKDAVDVFLSTKHTEGLDEIREFLLKADKEVKSIDEKTRKE